MHSFSRPLTGFVTLLANRALRAPAPTTETGEGELARFAGQHIALVLGGKRFVWRIDAQGALHAVHPMVQAACTLTCRLGGSGRRAGNDGAAVHISGSGEMLAVLSKKWQERDTAAFLAALCGERAAPPVLAALEHCRARAQDTLTRHTAAPAAAAAQAAAVYAFQQRVDAFAARVQRAAAQG